MVLCYASKRIIQNVPINNLEFKTQLAEMD